MGAGYMWGNGMGYFPILMPIFMIIVFLVILYFLFGRGSCSSHGDLQRSSSSTPPTGESALDIIKKRYARGEIQKEEFEALRKELG